MCRYLVSSVLGACLLVFASGVAALAGGSTYYAGRTPKAKSSCSPWITPRAVRSSTRSSLTRSSLPGNRRRDRSPVQLPGVPDSHQERKSALAMNDIFQRFSWTGTVTSTGASGKENIDLPAFDNGGWAPGLRRGFALMESAGPGSGLDDRRPESLVTSSSSPRHRTARCTTRSPTDENYAGSRQLRGDASPGPAHAQPGELVRGSDLSETFHGLAGDRRTQVPTLDTRWALTSGYGLRRNVLGWGGIDLRIRRWCPRGAPYSSLGCPGQHG